MMTTPADVRALERKVMENASTIALTDTARPYGCRCTSCSPEGDPWGLLCSTALRDDLVAAVALALVDDSDIDLDRFLARQVADSGSADAPGIEDAAFEALRAVVATCTNVTWRPMRAPDCPMPVHSSAAFTWTGKVGVAEESEMGRSYCTRAWSDAADVGFTVRSARTGTALGFVQHRVIERQGEVQATVFRDVEGRGIEVHILND